MSLKSAVLVVGFLAGSFSAATAGGESSQRFNPPFPTPATPPAPVVSSPAVPAAAAALPSGKTHLTRSERREAHRQAALQRRAAKLSLASAPPPKVLPPSTAVASVPPTTLAGAIEKPAPTPPKADALDAASAAPPHDAVSPPSLGELIARHAMANGIPVKLARAVVTIESRGNPRAANHGALGLMQIKYDTARAAGFSGAATGLLVAETNLRFGMKVLANAYRAAGGDLCGALMRYQTGHLATHPSRANRVYCSKARSLMAGA